MITQFEIHALLADKIPQLTITSCPYPGSMQIYISMNNFAHYTRQAVKTHNFIQARKCFEVAEDLYLNGDGIVRLLIENNFLDSFSSLNASNKIEKLILKSIIPETLFAVYTKQVRQTAS